MFPQPLPESLAPVPPAKARLLLPTPRHPRPRPSPSSPSSPPRLPLNRSNLNSQHLSSSLSDNQCNRQHPSSLQHQSQLLILFTRNLPIGNL